MVLNDWNDVLEARKAADLLALKAAEKYELADSGRLSSTGAVDRCLSEARRLEDEAFRLEIRALGVTVSHAIAQVLDAR